MAVEDGRAGTCEDCSAPLARGQRYCLGCGERNGPRSPQLLASAWTCRSRSGADSLEREQPSAPRLASAGRRRAAGACRDSSRRSRASTSSTPPSRRVSALLVLVFLGFGVLLGNVASSRVEDSLAASARPQIKLLLPAASSAAATTPEASPAASNRPKRLSNRRLKPPARRNPRARLRRRSRPPQSTGSQAGEARRQIERSGGERTRDEAAADQARVRDHALERAVRVRIRAGLDGAVPLAHARAPRRAARALLRRRASAARQRDRAAERTRPDAGDGGELPRVRRSRAGESPPAKDR